MVCDDLLLVVVGVSDSCGDLWVLGFARFGLVFGFWVWCAIGFCFGGDLLWVGLSFASARVSMGFAAGCCCDWFGGSDGLWV